MIIYCCGYRTTGKDFLRRQLNGDAPIEFNWIIYGKRELKSKDQLFLQLLTSQGKPRIIRRAFADRVKEEVVAYLQEHFHLPYDLEWYEANKEKHILNGKQASLVDFGHNIRFKENDLGDKSFRDLCILLGNGCREVDLNHWIYPVLEKHMATKNNSITKNNYDNDITNNYDNGITNNSSNNSITNNIISMVCDWRFHNEHEVMSQYEDITSLRVYNSKVPIPPKENKEEHELDNFLTDFLLLRSEDDWSLACELFPQYRDYVKISY